MANRDVIADAISKRMLEGTLFDSEEILAWMDSGDVELQGAACDILLSESAVIRGPLDRGRVEAFLVDYLVDRMKEAGKPTPARVFDIPPHVAARTLALLYRHWVGEAPEGASADSVGRIRDELRNLYLDGDEEQKGCVVNGALEHILEDTERRQDFAAWLSEPSLARAVQAAAEWSVRPHRG